MGVDVAVQTVVPLGTRLGPQAAGTSSAVPASDADAPPHTPNGAAPDAPAFHSGEAGPANELAPPAAALPPPRAQQEQQQERGGSVPAPPPAPMPKPGSGRWKQPHPRPVLKPVSAPQLPAKPAGGARAVAALVPPPLLEPRRRQQQQDAEHAAPGSVGGPFARFAYQRAAQPPPPLPAMRPLRPAGAATIQQVALTEPPHQPPAAAATPATGAPANKRARMESRSHSSKAGTAQPALAPHKPAPEFRVPTLPLAAKYAALQLQQRQQDAAQAAPRAALAAESAAQPQVAATAGKAPASPERPAHSAPPDAQPAKLDLGSIFSFL